MLQFFLILFFSIFSSPETVERLPWTFFMIDIINRYAGKTAEWKNIEGEIVQIKNFVFTTFFFHVFS